MTANECLAEIKARAEAATEGPWEACDSGEPSIWAPDHIVMGNYTRADQWESPAWEDGTEADREFIAHARTDVPALVAALEAVLELHQPDWSDWGLDHPEEGANCSCGHNGDYEDCPTVQAVNEALGVDQ